MMTTDVARAPFSAEQIDLIKRTVARGATDDELKLFLHACTKTGLDPLMKQIYAVKRYDSALNRQVMAIQTGIDGLRLVAERSEMYAPGREPAYVYDAENVLVSATAFIKKMTKDGTWHDIAATARYDEYVQRKQDGQPTTFWKRMPHVMLAKVAEALALRRAFPQDLSGIYSTEEMTQADVEETVAQKFKPLPVEPAAELEQPPQSESESVAISRKQQNALEAAIRAYAKHFERPEEDVRMNVKKFASCEHMTDLTTEQYREVMDMLLVSKAKPHARRVKARR